MLSNVDSVYLPNSRPGNYHVGGC